MANNTSREKRTQGYNRAYQDNGKALDYLRETMKDASHVE